MVSYIIQSEVGKENRSSYFSRPISGDLELNIKEAWVGLNPPGGENVVHVHPGSLVSGVVYVSTGYSPPPIPSSTSGFSLSPSPPISSNETTSIFFLDPRSPSSPLLSPPFSFQSSSQHPPSSPNKIEMRVKGGDIVVFPSWLEHFVLQHGGSHMRVIVAFNCGVKWKREIGGCLASVCKHLNEKKN